MPVIYQCNSPVSVCGDYVGDNLTIENLFVKKHFIFNL